MVAGHGQPVVDFDKLPAGIRSYIGDDGFWSKDLLVQPDLDREHRLPSPRGCKETFSSYYDVVQHAIRIGDKTRHSYEKTQSLAFDIECPWENFGDECIFDWEAAADRTTDKQTGNRWNRTVVDCLAFDARYHNLRREVIACHCGEYFPSPLHAATHMVRGCTGGDQKSTWDTMWTRSNRLRPKISFFSQEEIVQKLKSPKAGQRKTRRTATLVESEEDEQDQTGVILACRHSGTDYHCLNSNTLEFLNSYKHVFGLEIGATKVLWGRSKKNNTIAPVPGWMDRALRPRPVPRSSSTQELYRYSA